VLAPVDWGSACFLALVVSPLLRELNLCVLIGNSFFGRVRRYIAASQQLFPAGRCCVCARSDRLVGLGRLLRRNRAGSHSSSAEFAA
jgi:hypothetical protein